MPQCKTSSSSDRPTGNLGRPSLSVSKIFLLANGTNVCYYDIACNMRDRRALFLTTFVFLPMMHGIQLSLPVPPLFMFGFSSESKLRHRMEQMAHEADHSRSTAEWAEEHRERTIAEENARISQASSGLQRMHTSSVTTERTAADVDNLSSEDVERQLTELYNQSVQNSGVRIVPSPVQLLARESIQNSCGYWRPDDSVHFQGSERQGTSSVAKQADAHSCLWAGSCHCIIIGANGCQGLPGFDGPIYY